jgi:hypothetical protein
MASDQTIRNEQFSVFVLGCAMYFFFLIVYIYLVVVVKVLPAKSSSSTKLASRLSLGVAVATLNRLDGDNLSLRPSKSNKSFTHLLLVRDHHSLRGRLLTR